MNRPTAFELASLASLASCAFVPTLLAQSYSFTLLDSTIPGSTATALAHAISGDGQVIGGGDTRYALGEQPLIWRNIAGQWVRSHLPVPPAGSMWAYQNLGRAMSLSCSGDVVAGVVGNTGVVGTPNYGRAAAWTNVLSGQPQLHQIEPERRSSTSGVSADGSMVLWWSVDLVELPPWQGPFADARTHRWLVGTQSSALLAPTNNFGSPGFSAASLYAPQCISNDGESFALTSIWMTTTNPRRVFRANSSGLLELPPGSGVMFDVAGPNRTAHAISGDGRVIVGYAGGLTSGEPTRAVVWNQEGQARALPFSTRPPASGPLTLALDLSADGSIIVGSQHAQQPFPGAIQQVSTSRAVYWLNGGHRFLANVLQAEGVDLGGAVPAVITGVSDDGGTMVGLAMTSNLPDASIVSFVATILPPGTCDDIDFNRDGSRFDPLDIDAFLSVFSEGPCLPAGASCRDIDFNNDGSLFDPEDVDAFLRVFSEGPCTL